MERNKIQKPIFAYMSGTDENPEKKSFLFRSTMEIFFLALLIEFECRLASSGFGRKIGFASATVILSSLVI